jgi:cyclic beta-1,2-glucan synthetase
MDSAMKRLVDDKLKIVKLFTPPFANTEKEPGYIKSYPPGVRENGGQYTHAATWFVIALAEMGRTDDAWRCFQMLNPINHALDAEAAELYGVEPYVVAADIYSEGTKGGRGGWTWYTGSAGWLYRAAVEGILGIRKEGDRLRIDPKLPSHWDGFTMTINLAGATYNIQVKKAEGTKTAVIEVNGRKLKDATIKLSDGGERDVLVTIPA